MNIAPPLVDTTGRLEHSATRWGALLCLAWRRTTVRFESRLGFRPHADSQVNSSTAFPSMSRRISARSRLEFGIVVVLSVAPRLARLQRAALAYLRASLMAAKSSSLSKGLRRT